MGKNKLVDRFLHLLNAEREYIQLHRDSTMQTLTLLPTVEDGQIIYKVLVMKKENEFSFRHKNLVKYLCRILLRLGQPPRVVC